MRKVGQYWNGSGFTATSATSATSADNATTVGGLATSSLLQITGAQSAAGVKTFSDGVKATEKLVIPLDEPSSLENGDIWIA